MTKFNETPLTWKARQLEEENEMPTAKEMISDLRGPPGAPSVEALMLDIDSKRATIAELEQDVETVKASARAAHKRAERQHRKDLNAQIDATNGLRDDLSEIHARFEILASGHTDQAIEILKLKQELKRARKHSEE